MSVIWQPLCQRLIDRLIQWPGVTGTGLGGPFTVRRVASLLKQGHTKAWMKLEMIATITWARAKSIALIIGSRIGESKKNMKLPIAFCNWLMTALNQLTNAFAGVAIALATEPATAFKGCNTAALAASALAYHPAPAVKFCTNC